MVSLVLITPQQKNFKKIIKIPCNSISKIKLIDELELVHFKKYELELELELVHIF